MGKIKNPLAVKSDIDIPKVEMPVSPIKHLYRDASDLPLDVETKSVEELYHLKWATMDKSEAYWHLNDLIQIKKDKEQQVHSLELIKNTRALEELRAQNGLMKLAVEELVQTFRTIAFQNEK